LIRTGIGALIVGAGELVYWFTRLAFGAGGFGEAMGLLKDVAVEVWDRIKMGASSAGAAATAMFYDLKADAASGMAGAIESVVGFGNATANTFEGALLAVREIWSRLPDVIGDLVFSAANRMLDGIEAMLNGAIRRIDAFTGNIRDALAAVGIETTFGQIGEISLGDIPNPFAGASADAGTAAAEAFRRAFEDKPLTVPDLGLDAIAAEALATANTYRQAASDLANGATAPLTSWGALRDAVAGTGEEGAAALDEATVSADRLSDAMARAGGAAGSAGDRIATGWRAVSESLQAYAAEALNWGKGLGETLTGAFSGAESAFRSFVETGKFDFRGLVRSILADLAVLSFKRAVAGQPVEIYGARDHATYRDNWQFLTAVADPWGELSAGQGVLVNEQLFRRAGLGLGAQVGVGPGVSLPVLGIYGDYGNPQGQVIVNEAVFARLFPEVTALRFGLRLAPDRVEAMRLLLQAEAGVAPTSMIDQAAIKALSLSVFERTFTVTTALNILTLAVAGFAMLMSLLTLAAMRLPQLAPVWALGVTRQRLAIMDLMRAVVLAALTGVLALPLGLALAWALLAVVNVEAFGWRLPMYLFWNDYLRLGGLALLAAALAAFWPAWRLSRLPPAQLLGVFRHER
jgi:hypothetical protein